MVMVVAVSVLPPSTAVRIQAVTVSERHPSLGVVRGLEVVAVRAVDDVTGRHHLQVGPDAVVPGPGVIAEVDDTAFVGALVGQLDSGEAEFVGDVASYNLHHLAQTHKKRDEIIKKNSKSHYKVLKLWLNSVK